MEKRTPYSTLISAVRKEKGLSVDDMERITLTRNLTQIEAGTAELTDMQINLFANVLGLSAEAMRQGIRKERKDVSGYLNIFKEQLEKAKVSETYFLNAIQEMSKPERFAARYQEAEDVQDNQIRESYYYIFDMKEQHVVTDEAGEPKTYQSAIEALKAATEMEQKYKTKNMQESISQQNEKNMQNAQINETAPRL